MPDVKKPVIAFDPWHPLNQLTPARIGLGRAGMSLPTRANLDFQLAHALARDAVHIHLGRLLNEQSINVLKAIESLQADAVIVVADGLSSKAIANHAIPFLELLVPALKAVDYQLAPICLVKHGRVAIGDAIAEHYQAKLCITLIGERPGLSSPDSMGIYFTYQAKAQISTDADRNCISNIHVNGLSYEQALTKLLFLIKGAEQLKCTGVLFKDETSDKAIDQLDGKNFLLN